MPSWSPFPYDSEAYRYDPKALKKNWPELHRGDCEPYPSEDAQLEAWAAFHAGDFERAVLLADEIGLEAHAVANKATGIYANYLEEDERTQIALFQQAIDRAAKAIKAFPQDPNAHYFHAFNLGRYSQSISVVKAVKQGYAGKIRDSLETTLELQPRHAEAHTAMGLYHAEIIDKMGKMIGSMTYGASESEAIEHLEAAVSLTPESPIAHIEYANGLYLIYGDKRIEDVTDLYIKASELEPRDAMERLDVEYAHSELE